MLIKRLASSWWARLGMAACAALCLVVPAQAAVYTGIWDPTYGAPFANLGWRGTAQFIVPDGCEPAGTADVNNAQQCDGAAAVSAAEVTFYDVTDPTKATLATLDFNPNSLVIDTLQYINGALTELSTTLSDFVGPGVDLTKFGVQGGTEFSLQFTLDGPQLAWGSCNPDSRECAVSGFNDGTQFPPTFVITKVPEPTSLWLVLLALASLALVGRRALPTRPRS